MLYDLFFSLFFSFLSHCCLLTPSDFFLYLSSNRTVSLIINEKFVMRPVYSNSKLLKLTSNSWSEHFSNFLESVVCKDN